MSYWDVPQGRALLRVSAGRPMEGCKVPYALLVERRVVVAFRLCCDWTTAICFVPQICHIPSSLNIIRHWNHRIAC